jgi:hypothetical protein
MIENKYSINVYSLSVLPDTKEAKDKIREIVSKLDKELKLAFNNYIYWGNLYSPVCHYEDITFENINLSNSRKEDEESYTLIIRHNT